MTADGKRRVAVSWSDLELAFTWRMEEGGHYLDLETAEVVTVTATEDDELGQEEIDAGIQEGRFLWIDPIESSVQFRWMEEFVDTLRSERLRERLVEALRGRQPFRRFKEELIEAPAQRERWFLFQRDRVREAIRDWMEENGLEMADDGPSTPSALE